MRGSYLIIFCNNASIANFTLLFYIKFGIRGYQLGPRIQLLLPNLCISNSLLSLYILQVNKPEIVWWIQAIKT